VLPLSLFRSRTFSTSSLLMTLVGFGMFAAILCTPLFAQGVLGKTATGSGTVLTSLVFSMTCVGVIGGQIMARIRRVKPFAVFGTIVTALGIYLLSTLAVDSAQRTLAFSLALTGLGLGLIMPTAMLAVQTTVGKAMLGVATSSLQFLRLVGSTVGTAIIGSVVTRGYADNLTKTAPAQAPARLVEALQNPRHS
jgi:MFS family permease